MLCQNCGNAEATTHIKRIVNGEASEIHLCYTCAEHLGYANMFSGFGYNIDNMLQNFFPEFTRALPSVESECCPVCHTSFADVIREGHMGCAECYKTFYDKLRPSLARIHGRATHVGKASGKEQEISDIESLVVKSSTENDVAISTKVTIARNVKDINFTPRLSIEEKYDIADKIDAILDEKLPGKFATTPMNEVGRDLQISLAERNLVSPEFVSMAEGRTFITTSDETLSMMVCESDHLKMQAVLPGLSLDTAYTLVDTLDSILDSEIGFAYDENLGYLTESPTDIGTAMRASVTLQLPALAMRGQIPHLANTVSKLGLVLTGAYGEADEPLGSLYQLSNQVTLGISEQAAIDNLKAISLSIVEQERALRLELMNSLKFQDTLWRSYGTLRNARVLSFAEFMEALSYVRIGVSAGEIKIPNDELNQLIFTMQPATLNVSFGQSLDRQIRDVRRAEKVREIFEK